MKSSGGKEGVEINQRYVFLSNPESIVEEVERSVPVSSLSSSSCSNFSFDFSIF